MSPIVVVLAALGAAVVPALSADILAFFPLPVKSHQNFFQPVIRGLAERGHKVTYFTGVPMDKPHPNCKEVLLTSVLEAGKKFTAISNDTYNNPLNAWTPILIRSISYKVIENVLKDENVLKLISSKDLHFDAVLLETSFSQEPFIALHHKFKAVTIEMVSLGDFHWAHWLHGNPIDTSYMAESMTSFSDRMNLYERLVNTVHSWALRFVYYVCYAPKFERLMNEGIRYEGWESRPPMMEMMENISLVLQNTHFSVNFPSPLSPNYKEVGGVFLSEPDPLPKDLQKFMDEAPDGVIFFSIGSHLDPSFILGPRIQEELAKAFDRIPQRVVLKWGPGFKNPPKNVLVKDWLPQSAILAHKNMKLFITHGGFLSLTEAINYGVPMIGVPFIGDQMKNVHTFSSKGIGLHLSANNLTETSLLWAINEVMTNKRYKENMLRQSLLMKDNPLTPMDTAMYWIEYVLKHRGAPHLRPASASMPWYSRALLDVYALLLLIISILLYTLYKTFACLFNCVMCRKKKDKKVKKKKE